MTIRERLRAYRASRGAGREGSPGPGKEPSAEIGLRPGLAALEEATWLALNVMEVSDLAAPLREAARPGPVPQLPVHLESAPVLVDRPAPLEPVSMEGAPERTRVAPPRGPSLPGAKATDPSEGRDRLFAAKVAVSVVGIVLMFVYVSWNGAFGWPGLRGPMYPAIGGDHVLSGVESAAVEAGSLEAGDPIADLSWAPAPNVALDVPGRPPSGPSRFVVPAIDGSRRVALTFDDNYAPKRAVPVLRALVKVHAPATVFLTAGPTRSYPEVTALVAQAPLLEVGDHAATHTELTGMSPDRLEAEVGAGAAAFREITGRHTSRLFRPPGGHYDASVLDVAGEKGFPWTVGFSPGPADYEGLPARQVLHSIVSGEITPGSLVLLHFNADHTAELIPELVGALRARGYRLVTVSQLLKGQERYLDLASTDPAYPAALALDRADIVNGYPTGDYGTWEPMSRVDLAWAMIHLLRPVSATSPASSGAEPQSDVGSAPATGSTVDFADVAAAGEGPSTPLAEVTAEQKAAIEACVRAGLMQGGTDTDGKAVFWPWASVRRVDLALAVAKALGPVLSAGTSAVRADIPGEAVPADVGGEAGPVVARVAGVGLMELPAAGFGPLEPVGRLQASLVLYRLAEVLRPELVGTSGLPEWWRGQR